MPCLEGGCQSRGQSRLAPCGPYSFFISFHFKSAIASKLIMDLGMRLPIVITVLCCRKCSGSHVANIATTIYILESTIII